MGTESESGEDLGRESSGFLRPVQVPGSLGVGGVPKGRREERRLLWGLGECGSQGLPKTVGRAPSSIERDREGVCVRRSFSGQEAWQSWQNRLPSQGSRRPKTESG